MPPSSLSKGLLLSSFRSSCTSQRLRPPSAGHSTRLGKWLYCYGELLGYRRKKGKGGPEKEGNKGKEDRALSVGWQVTHHWRIHSHRLAMQTDSSMVKNRTSLWHLVASWSSRVHRRSLITRSYRETKSKLVSKAVLGKPKAH